MARTFDCDCPDESTSLTQYRLWNEDRAHRRQEALFLIVLIEVEVSRHHWSASQTRGAVRGGLAVQRTPWKVGETSYCLA